MEEKTTKKKQKTACKYTEWDRLEAELPRQMYHNMCVIFVHRYQLTDEGGYKMIEDKLFGLNLRKIDCIAKIDENFCAIRLQGEPGGHIYNINEIRRRTK